MPLSIIVWVSEHTSKGSYIFCFCIYRYPLEGGLGILCYICWGFKNKNWLGLAQREMELANKPGDLSSVLEPG